MQGRCRAGTTAQCVPPKKTVPQRNAATTVVVVATATVAVVATATATMTMTMTMTITTTITNTNSIIIITITITITTIITSLRQHNILRPVAQRLSAIALTIKLAVK